MDDGGDGGEGISGHGQGGDNHIGSKHGDLQLSNSLIGDADGLPAYMTLCGWWDQCRTVASDKGDGARLGFTADGLKAAGHDHASQNVYVWEIQHGKCPRWRGRVPQSDRVRAGLV